MELRPRRLGALLLLLVVLGAGFWGYFGLLRADRQPPRGATFVWAESVPKDAYLFVEGRH